jgi:hypothetical protein
MVSHDISHISPHASTWLQHLRGFESLASPQSRVSLAAVCVNDM